MQQHLGKKNEHLPRNASIKAVLADSSAFGGVGSALNSLISPTRLGATDEPSGEEILCAKFASWKTKYYVSNAGHFLCLVIQLDSRFGRLTIQNTRQKK
jgi:hypothetical protein